MTNVSKNNSQKGHPSPLSGCNYATIIAYLTTLIILVGGGILASYLKAQDIVSPRHAHNILFHLYGNFEPWLIPIVAVILAGVFTTQWFSKTLRPFSLPSTHPKFIITICVLVFILTLSGTYIVTLNYPLSMDEYLMKFMVKFIAKFDVAAEISEEWRGLIHTISPIYTKYHFLPHEWTTQYLPVFSLFGVPFHWVGHFEWYPPFLAALSVLVLWKCGILIWREKPETAWIPVFLLISSSQFLITSMTLYAMTGHLFLSLLWIWVYLKDEKWSWLLLPWIGVLAIGLQQPIPHAIFVFPFCIRILRTRPPKLTLYIAVVYLFGCLYWYLWLKNLLYTDFNFTNRSIFDSICLPEQRQLLSRAINLVYLISWQNPIVFVLFIVSLLQWKQHHTLERDLILSVFITFGFYFFFSGTGGHGWGSRYSHVILGNLALISGFTVTRWKTNSMYFLLVSTLASLVILFPIRAIQVHYFTKPYAETDRYLDSIEADFIYIDTVGGYYSRDFIRNDPYLKNRPIRVNYYTVSPLLSKEFEKRGTHKTVMFEEFSKFGIAPVHLNPKGVSQFQENMHKHSDYCYYLSFSPLFKAQQPSESK